MSSRSSQGFSVKLLMRFTMIYMAFGSNGLAVNPDAPPAPPIGNGGGGGGGGNRCRQIPWMTAYSKIPPLPKGCKPTGRGCISSRSNFIAAVAQDSSDSIVTHYGPTRPQSSSNSASPGNPREKSRCPDSIYHESYLPFLPTEEELGEGQLLYYTESTSDNFAGPWHLKFSGVPVMFATAVHNGTFIHYSIVQPNAEVITFRITKNNVGLPVEGLPTDSAAGSPDRVTFVDAGGQPTAYSNAVYVRQLFSNGSHVDFLKAGGNVKKYLTAGGRSYTLPLAETMVITKDLQNQLHYNAGPGSGNLRQVKTGAGMFDIVRVDPRHMEIRKYPPAQVGGFDGQVYAVIGSPVSVTRFVAPAGTRNTVTITMLKGAVTTSTEHTVTYSGATEQWIQNITSGAFQYRRTLNRGPWLGHPADHYQSIWQARLLAAPGMAYNASGWGDYVQEIKSNNFFPMLDSETFPGGITRSKSYVYELPGTGIGERSSQVTSTGTVMDYDYDPVTRRLHTRTATQVVPAGGGSMPAQFSEVFDFSPLMAGDVLNPFDVTPRMVTEFSDNVITGRSFYAYLPSPTGYSEIREWATDLNVTGMGDPSSMRSEVHFYPGGSSTGLTGAQAGRIKRKIATDKTITDFEYAYVGAGELLITTTYQLPSSGAPLVGQSIRAKMLYNKLNQPVELITGVYLSTGWSDYQKLTCNYDADDQVTSLIQKDLYSNQELTLLNQTWDGGRLMQSTDAEGITTINTYFPGTDVLESTTRQAIAAHGTYPAQDAITTTWSGTFSMGDQQTPVWKVKNATTTAGSLTLTASTELDALGRTVSSTDENGLTTSTTYTPDFRSSTTTFPNSGTREEHWTSMGQSLRITGTGVIPTYQHLLPLAAGGFRTTVFTGTDLGPRYAASETDAASRKVREIKPAFNGLTAETTFNYETGCGCGKPGTILRTGKPAEVIEYDSLMEVSRSGLSADGNTLELNSPNDRISEKIVEFSRDASSTPNKLWRVTSSYVYPTPGSNARKLISSSRELLAGLTGNQVSRQEDIDIGGNVTKVITQTDRVNKLSQTLTTHSVITGVATSASRGGRPTVSRGPADTKDSVTTYDALGRVATVSTPGIANVQTTTYQPGKARAASVLAPHGLLATYIYESQGNVGAGQVKEVQTAGAGSVFYTFDVHGRKLKTWGDRTYPTAYAYDPTYGELKTLTTWKDYTAQTGAALTTWNYEPSTGFLLSKKYLDNTGLNYTYDSAGRLLTRTDARNITTTYSYNAVMKELSDITYSDGTPAVAQTYDRLGRRVMTSTGTFARQSQVYAPDQLLEKSQAYSYDTDFSGTITSSDFKKVLTREYDPSLITRSNGYTLGWTATDASVVYAYEPVAGRLQSVTDPSSPGSPSFGYVYEPDRPHLIRYVNTPSHQVQNVWEPNRDILDYKNNLWISAFDYTVNAVGQRTGVAVAGTPAGGWTWGYDALGQVTSAAHSTNAGYSRAYQFDDIGNRRKAAAGLTLPPADNTASNLLNQYTSIGGAAPGYDAAGNLTSDGGGNTHGIARLYTWDAENRLSEVKTAAGAVIASYRYDAFHRRISKTTGTTITWYLYDGWNLIGEYTGSTGSVPILSRTHTWGTDLSGSLQGAGGVGGLLSTTLKTGPNAGCFIPCYDGNGNITDYVKPDRTPVAHYHYDPFGHLLAASGSLHGEFRFRFSTKSHDSETDFYYYGYRYYSTWMSRWLNRDPIGERGGINLYGMVANSIPNYIDKLGMELTDIDNEVINKAKEYNMAHSLGNSPRTPLTIDSSRVGLSALTPEIFNMMRGKAQGLCPCGGLLDINEPVLVQTKHLYSLGKITVRVVGVLRSGDSSSNGLRWSFEGGLEPQNEMFDFLPLLNDRTRYGEVINFGGYIGEKLGFYGTYQINFSGLIPVKLRGIAECY